MNITIRAATLADRPAIDELANLAVHDTYDPVAGAAYAQDLLDTWWGSALDPDIETGHVLVALDGEELVGVAQLGEWKDEPVMWKLYILPERRSQGIGPKLIDGLIDLLPSGTPRLLTEHIIANERAGDFYQREGFDVTSTEEGDEPGLGFVWRARQLHP